MVSRVSAESAWTCKRFLPSPAPLPEIEYYVLVPCWLPWMLRIPNHCNHSDQDLWILRIFAINVPIHQTFVISSIRCHLHTEFLADLVSFLWELNYSCCPAVYNQLGKQFPFMFLVDSSRWKILLVAFRCMSVGGRDLGQSDSLSLSSTLLTPGGPIGAVVVLVVSSSCWMDSYSCASYSASFSTAAPATFCCRKRCWRSLRSLYCSITASYPVPSLHDYLNSHCITCSVSISSLVSGTTSK